MNKIDKYRVVTTPELKNPLTTMDKDGFTMDLTPFNVCTEKRWWQKLMFWKKFCRSEDHFILTAKFLSIEELEQE